MSKTLIAVLERIADEASGGPAAVFGGGADIGDGGDGGLGQFFRFGDEGGGEFLAGEEGFDGGQADRDGGDGAEGDGGGFDAPVFQEDAGGGHDFADGLGAAGADFAEPLAGFAALGEAEGEDDFVGASGDLAVGGPELGERHFADAGEGGEQDGAAGDEEGGGGIAGRGGVGGVAAEGAAGLDLRGADGGGGGGERGQMARGSLGNRPGRRGSRRRRFRVVRGRFRWRKVRAGSRGRWRARGRARRRPTGP